MIDFQAADLQFEQFFQADIKETGREIGTALNELSIKGVLNSSMTVARLMKILESHARILLMKKLELDMEAVKLKPHEGTAEELLQRQQSTLEKLKLEWDRFAKNKAIERIDSHLQAALENLKRGLMADAELAVKAKVASPIICGNSNGHINNPLEGNMKKVLATMISEGEDEDFNGTRLQELTGLTSQEINDAIELLAESGAIEVVKLLGTAPYHFGVASVTARGRYFYHETQRPSDQHESEGLSLARPLNPVGSPFGFNEEDWETVALRKADNTKLYVVIGFQFLSDFYSSNDLVNNVKEKLQQALIEYNRGNFGEVTLEFIQLGAGYGEHLFNRIARDIIAADIAIFDTSDKNPNVMIEMGVALTWGIRVIPIREEAAPDLPSDISGQTWIRYRNSMDIVLDDQFDRKLSELVKRAIRKKNGT